MMPQTNHIWRWTTRVCIIFLLVKKVCGTGCGCGPNPDCGKKASVSLSCPSISACKNGDEYYEGSCYEFTTVKDNAWKAFMNCRVIGGDLVTIETADENQFLANIAKTKHSGEHFWIGLTDMHEEGDWRWFATGRPALFTSWNVPDHQPDNYGDEGCVILGAHSRWSDFHCGSGRFPYICEFRVTS